MRTSNCLHFVGLCALRDKGPRHKDVHAQWQINFSFKFQKFFTKSCAFLEFGLVASAKPLLCRGEHRKFGIEGDRRVLCTFMGLFNNRLFSLLSTNKQAKKIAELGVGKTFFNRTVWTRSRRGVTKMRLERTLKFNPISRFVGLWHQYLLIIGL